MPLAPDGVHTVTYVQHATETTPPGISVVVMPGYRKLYTPPNYPSQMGISNHDYTIIA